MPTKEEVYDAQISPLMTQIIEIAKTNGIDFIASFELGVTNTEEAEDVPLHCHTLVNQGRATRLTFMDMARQADSNADALIIGLLKYAQKYGNESSAYLHRLGVPVGTKGTERHSTNDI